MFKTATQRRLIATPTRVYIPSTTTSLPRVPLFASRFSSSAMVNQSVSDAIKTDHRELETYYKNIMDATDHDTATRWQNQLVWELARHSIAEELVVYPAFEKYLGQKGKSMADKDRAEHNQLKIDLKEFQNMKSTDPKFKPTLQALFKELQDHIAEEERDDLPSLETAIARDESESMASSFERTKLFVPSRSHPTAPDKPPFETVVGLMTAPIDKLADMFRKFPKQETPGARV